MSVSDAVDVDMEQKQAHESRELADLPDLPDIPLMQVLRYLGPHDLAAVCKVLPRWARLAALPSFWRGRTVSFENIQALERLCACVPPIDCLAVVLMRVWRSRGTGGNEVGRVSFPAEGWEQLTVEVQSVHLGAKVLASQMSRRVRHLRLLELPDAAKAEGTRLSRFQLAARPGDPAKSVPLPLPPHCTTPGDGDGGDSDDSDDGGLALPRALARALPRALPRALREYEARPPGPPPPGTAKEVAELWAALAGVTGIERLEVVFSSHGALAPYPFNWPDPLPCLQDLQLQLTPSHSRTPLSGPDDYKICPAFTSLVVVHRAQLKSLFLYGLSLAPLLAKCPSRTLRQAAVFVSVGTCAALARQPLLMELRLEGVSSPVASEVAALLSGANLPSLRVLSIRAGAPLNEVVRALACGHLKALTSLRLTVPQETLQVFGAALAVPSPAAAFPALRELTLCHAPTPQVLKSIAVAGHNLPALRHLVLRGRLCPSPPPGQGIANFLEDPDDEWNAGPPGPPGPPGPRPLLQVHHFLLPDQPHPSPLQLRLVRGPRHRLHLQQQEVIHGCRRELVLRLARDLGLHVRARACACQGPGEGLGEGPAPAVADPDPAAPAPAPAVPSAPVHLLIADHPAGVLCPECIEARMNHRLEAASVDLVYEQVKKDD